MHIIFNHGDKRLALACDKVWPFLFQVDRDVFIERWSVLFNDCESGLPTSNHRMYPYKRSKTWKYWYCVYWWDKQFYKHVLMKSWDHLVSLLLGIERKKQTCVCVTGSCAKWEKHSQASLLETSKCVSESVGLSSWPSHRSTTILW